MKKKILSITPIRHIKGVVEELSKFQTVEIIDDPSLNELEPDDEVVAIYTNPNKSRVYIGSDFLEKYNNLQVVCTASTGTVHIDKKECRKRGIKVLSITEERETISKITSTAEHAFCLMMNALRKTIEASKDVGNGGWDYMPFIGRQVNKLTIGVIGYGRLGTLFAHYCNSFGAKVLVYDPYKDVVHVNIEQVRNMEQLFSQCDVISLHVHVTEETKGFINEEMLSLSHKDLAIINTSRGEIIDEDAMERHVERRPGNMYATDVIAKEQDKERRSLILELLKAKPKQVIVTPHIAGMTSDAQEMAYGRAAKMLTDYLNEIDD